MCPVFINRHRGSGGVVLKPGDELYTMIIDQSVDDPAGMITYEDMCKGFTPAHHDFSTEGYKETLGFDPGSWKDAFFMKVRPCMLKYDGTVDYYLDPNDYTKKADGTASDNINVDYGGNVMIEFPRTYLRFEKIGDKKHKISVANRKFNDDFKCWAHISAIGTELPYVYYSAYEGIYLKDSNLNISLAKSISRPKVDVSSLNGVVYDSEYDLCLANNRDDRSQWMPMALCDRTLIDTLLLLIGKNVDVMSVFGYGYAGNNTEQTTTVYKFKVGLGDQKGLFYGCGHPYQNATYNNLVKVFGIERYYGASNKRLWGLVYTNKSPTVIKVKFTYGPYGGGNGVGYTCADDGYDMDVTGFVPANAIPASNVGSISEMDIGEYGYIPKSLKTGGAWGNYKKPSGMRFAYIYPPYGPLGRFIYEYSVRNTTEFYSKCFPMLACKPYAA